MNTQADPSKVYGVMMPHKFKGHELFDLVGDAFDPYGRYSWVYGARWTPELMDAFDAGSLALNTYLDSVDKDEPLVTLIMADPEEGEPGSDNGFEVKLTIQKILSALENPKLPKHVLADIVADNADLNTSDCILQVIAYNDVVFG